MSDLPTRADLFNIGAADVLDRSAARVPERRISAGEVFTEGSDINIAVGSASGMGEEVVRQVALRLKALFLDGAEGEDLDRLVADRFSPTVVRKEATPALATVEFTRSTGALPAGAIGAGTRVRTTDGVEFRTRLTVAFAALQLGPVSVVVEATLAGTGSTAAENTITEFVDQPFDQAVQVTNPEVAAGGDDRETDERLRERARDFYVQARRGTIGAIQFGATTVAGVRQATAVEEIDPNSLELTGRVELFIADAQGQANSALGAAVSAALLEFRGAGIIVPVISSVPLFVPIVYRLRFDAGTSSTEAFGSIQQGTLAAVNALRPRVTLEVSLLFTTARSVPGVIVLEDAIVAPVGDLVPTSNQVIRTRIDLVTAE